MNLSYFKNVPRLVIKARKVVGIGKAKKSND